MAGFEEERVIAAPAVNVWRLLHDPRRYPEWWAGTERVDAGGERPVRYLEGWPDFPMPMEVRAGADGSRVIISCLVSDIDVEWTLTPHPAGCALHVRFEMPEHEARRIPDLVEEARASLERLAARAATDGRPPGPTT